MKLGHSLFSLLACAIVAGVAFGSPQRTEDYSIVPNVDQLENFFGRELAVDGNTALVAALEDVPGSSFGGRIYFLELKQGRWEIEYVTGELPGGPINRSLVRATVEGDVAVLVGWSAFGPALGTNEYLYTFRRTPVEGWTLESLQRIPQVNGRSFAFWIELRAGLLTFTNQDHVITYERVGSDWRRRGGIKVGPLLVGADGPGFQRVLTRSDRDLFSIPVAFGSGLPIANEGGWHHYEWSMGRWVRSQVIGAPQPPNASGHYIPNNGAAADGDWFMFGSKPVFDGPSVVMALKRNQTTGQYEYHSTIRPIQSIPGAGDDDDFGVTIDLEVSTGRLLVGAPKSGTTGGGSAGRALLFTYDETLDEWIESEEYTYSGRANQDPNDFFDFGYQVALWDNGALVSASIATSASGTLGVGELFVFENSFGASYCSGTNTGSAQHAVVDVTGSNVLPHAGLRLEASSLPPLTLYSALISSSSASVVLPQGSGELLCIGGPRLATGGLRQTGTDGSASLGFDLSDPSLMGVLAGEHRFVQLWFRMPAGSGQPIGVTNAVEVQFR